MDFTSLFLLNPTFDGRVFGPVSSVVSNSPLRPQSFIGLPIGWRTKNFGVNYVFRQTPAGDTHDLSVAKYLDSDNYVQANISQGSSSLVRVDLGMNNGNMFYNIGLGYDFHSRRPVGVAEFRIPLF